MKLLHKKTYGCLLALNAILVSCRGQKSENPPIIPVQNMVDQTSYGPQSKNEFFKDKRATRPAVEGTVAYQDARLDKPLYEGIEKNSTLQNPIWVTKFPIKLSEEVLKKGRDDYNIYCSPCHGYDANNDGLVTQRAGGSIRPANLHDKEKIALPVGQIYQAVTNGVNNWNMPGFSEQLSVQDRWAIVAYVRALQLSKRSLTPSESHEKTKEKN